MTSRGEMGFEKMPWFGARLYQKLISSAATVGHFDDIARDIVTMLPDGRLLDIGMGPGNLLTALHQLEPRLELNGLDISQAMVDLAHQNLAGVASVRLGNVTALPWEEHSFDLVSCSGSFYLWDRPISGLTEIHRVLRPGGVALLYETTRDCDPTEVRAALTNNLRHNGLLHRWVAPPLFIWQLGRTYSAAEVRELVAQTPFATCEISRVALGNLPAWMRVQLHREP